MECWINCWKLRLAVAAFVMLASGCSAPEVEPKTDVRVSKVQQAPPQTVDRQAEIEPVETSAEAGLSDVEPNVQIEEAAYTPPFPDRTDLFAAPKRQTHNKAKSGEFNEGVELIGFAELDRPQALLLFNGQITTLAEGESLNGIEVVSIQRPKVVLQRGRQRWQTSLEN